MLAITAGQWAAGIATVLLLAAAGWFARGRFAARPDQVLAVARRRLDRGDWQGALDQVRRIRSAPVTTAAPWHESRRLFEGECLTVASEDALANRRFAEALQHYRDAAACLRLSPEEANRRVVEAMLAETRRLSVTEPDSGDLPFLLDQIRECQPQCSEASFWLAMSQLRRGETTKAIAELVAAHSGPQIQKIDTALYLGALWLREGQPKDALRVLAEANKTAPHCPLVAWQLGAALLAAGGDTLLAIRALQKATGPEGLVSYLANPNRIWAETLPIDSWIRNVASRSGTMRAAFRCPIGLDRGKEALTSARLSLGEALVRSGRAADAAPIYAELLRTDNSPDVRRGFGIALTEMGRYDEALPHLRAVIAAEQSPQPRTTGLLAVCMANAAGDRKENIRTALALVAKRPVQTDANWARSVGAVFAAAQSAGVSVSPAEIAELAEVLITSDAADPTAAALYDLLALRDSASLPIEAAWLYVRAAEQHKLTLTNDAHLFDRAFTDRPGMVRYFTTREWDFASAERLYLERWAGRKPGSFPSAPGPGYPAFAEAALLTDSRRLESQSQIDAARAVAHLALMLAPTSGPAYDRLAEIAYRRNRPHEAIDWLTQWQRRQPADPLPPARLALIDRANGRAADALAGLLRSLEIARGRIRAPIALAAAQIALALGQPESAVDLIDECLTFDSGNNTALAAKAALLWRLGRLRDLGTHVESMVKIEAEDPWYHYLVGVSASVAGNQDLALIRAKAAAVTDLPAEGNHLLGVLHLRRGENAEAAGALRRASASGSNVIGDHSLALCGQIAWRKSEYAEALKAWQAIAPARLKMWRLDLVIPGTTFLAGLQALRVGRCDEAAKWFKAAARFGFADPSRDALLAYSCLRGGNAAQSEQTLARLEEALTAAGPQPDIIERLARAYRLEGRLGDARTVLDRCPVESARLAHERGLVALAEGQLVPAERAFADAVRLDALHPAASANLVLTRLSLGRIADAVAALPSAIEQTPTHRRLLELVQQLASGTQAQDDSWSAVDDAAVAELLRNLGRLDPVEHLFDALLVVRPASAVVGNAQAELLPLRAKLRIDRGDPAGALRLLGRQSQGAPPLVRNLLGIAACLRQDFAGAARHFQSALPESGSDARVQQNLAIVRDWTGDAIRAGEHWQRFLDECITQISKPRALPDYHRRIAAIVRHNLATSREPAVV